MRPEQRETYRDFRLHVYRFSRSGHWQGMAKGGGTVLMTRAWNAPSSEAALADLRHGVDLHHDRTAARAATAGGAAALPQPQSCEFTGCTHAARWEARKRFGDGATLHVCDTHKPDEAKRPESLRRLPLFYDVTPLDRPENA